MFTILCCFFHLYPLPDKFWAKFCIGNVDNIKRYYKSASLILPVIEKLMSNSESACPETPSTDFTDKICWSRKLTALLHLHKCPFWVGFFSSTSLSNNNFSERIEWCKKFLIWARGTIAVYMANGSFRGSREGLPLPGGGGPPPLLKGYFSLFKKVFERVKSIPSGGEGVWAPPWNPWKNRWSCKQQ